MALGMAITDMQAYGSVARNAIMIFSAIKS